MVLTFPNIQAHTISQTVQTDGNKKTITVTVPMQENVIETIVRAVLSELGLKTMLRFPASAREWGNQII